MVWELSYSNSLEPLHVASASDTMATEFQEGVSQENPTSESEIPRGLSGTEMLPNLVIPDIISAAFSWPGKLTAVQIQRQVNLPLLHNGRGNKVFVARCNLPYQVILLILDNIE